MTQYPLALFSRTERCLRLFLPSPRPIPAPWLSYTQKRASSSIPPFTPCPSVTGEVSPSGHIYPNNLSICSLVGMKDFSHGHWLSFQSSITGFISAGLFLKMALCINHPQPAKRRKPVFFFPEVAEGDHRKKAGASGWWLTNMHNAQDPQGGCWCCSMCGLVSPWRSLCWCCRVEEPLLPLVDWPFFFACLIDWPFHSCSGNWPLVSFVMMRNVLFFLLLCVH